jgi:stage II sporulation protein M
LVLLLGFTSGGILAACGLFGMGFSTGATVASALSVAPPLMVAAAILPHGVLELAGFLMLGSLGLAPWTSLRRAHWHAQPMAWTSLLWSAGFGFALLFIAGIVETTLTPLVILRAR